MSEASRPPGGPRDADRRDRAPRVQRAGLRQAADSALDAGRPTFRTSLLAVLLADFALVASVAALLRPAGLVSGLLLGGAASAPFLFVLALRPVVRRLAVRAARRSVRDAVVVLTAVLAVTITVAATEGVRRSLDASLTRVATTRLGPVDEVVTLPDAAAASAAVDALVDLPASEVDGVLPVTVATATVGVTGPAGDVVQAVPDVQLVALDLDAARRFGGDPSATGLRTADAAAVSGGAAIVGADLARGLGVARGDEVVVFAGGVRRSVKVGQVLPATGLASLQWDGRGRGGSILLPPDALADVAARRSLVLVSNAGDSRTGARHTRPVSALLEQRLGPPVRLDGQLVSGHDGGDLGATVLPVKGALLGQQREAARRLGALLAAVAVLALAGAGFAVALVVAGLVDDRARELGMLRRFGLRRSQALGALSVEGWAYAAVAAAVGAPLGAALARAALSAANGTAGLELRAAPALPVVVVGFVAGLAGGSALVAALGVAAVLRDGRGRVAARWVRLAGALALAVGLAVVVFGADRRGPASLALGPAVALLGAAVLGTLSHAGRVVTGVAAALAVAWSALASVAVPSAFEGAPVWVTGVRALVAVSALSVLLAAAQPALTRLVATVAARRAAPRIAVLTALAGGARTAVFLASLATAAASFTVAASLGVALGDQPRQTTADARGGFDLLVRADPSGELGTDAVVGVDGVTRVASLAEATVDLGVGDTTPVAATLHVAGDDYLAGGPARLVARLPAFATDDAAWIAALGRSNLAVVAAPADGSGPRVRPGDAVFVRDPATGRSLTLRAAAVAAAPLRPGAAGIVVGARAAGALFGRALPPDTVAVAVGPRSAAPAVAARLQARLAPAGAEVVTFRAAVDDALGPQRRFLQLLQGYLVLTFLGGVAATAAAAARLAREREPETAVLRALGVQASSTVRARRLQAAVLGVQGVLVGAVVAVPTARALLRAPAVAGAASASVPFGVVGAGLAVAVGVLVLTAGLVARGAARPSAAALLRSAGPGSR